MSTANLTTNQKIDALYEMVTGLTQSQSSMQKDISSLKSSQSSMQKDISGMKESVSGMKKDITEMKSDLKVVKREVNSLIEMSSKSLLTAAQASDRLDKIETHLASKPGFTPFTSGAFVA